jgi:hypothetical protein
MSARFQRGMIAAALLAVLALGCSGGNQSGSTDKDAKRDADKKGTDGTTPNKTAKPDYTVTAEEFSREFLKDDKAADRKYKGKVVAVTGEVFGVHPREGGKEVLVQLKGAKKVETDIVPNLVQFLLDPESTKAGLELSKGQKVQITATYELWLVVAANLNKGSLKELSKSELVSIAAADLAGEVAGNPGAAATKYAGKDVIVAGELADVTLDKDSGSTFARFKGDGKTPVLVILGDNDARLLRKGQSVRLRAETSPQLYANNEVRLHLGTVVEIK